MLDDKTIKSMSKVEMVRCEVTGKLFPVDQCEVVIIKIIKSKSADINQYNLFNSVAKENKVVENGKPATVIPKALLDPASSEYNKAVHRNQSIIPSAFKDVFQKPAGLSDPMNG